MRRRLIQVLVALHPRPWRQRYGAELEDVAHEACVEGGYTLTSVSADLILSALREWVRLSPITARTVAGIAVIAAVAVATAVSSQTPHVRETPLRAEARAGGTSQRPLFVKFSPGTQRIVSMHRTPNLLTFSTLGGR